MVVYARGPRPTEDSPQSSQEKMILRAPPKSALDAVQEINTAHEQKVQDYVSRLGGKDLADQ
jgi:hypothetical protein